jgi:hypothetical protein
MNTIESILVNLKSEVKKGRSWSAAGNRDNKHFDYDDMRDSDNMSKFLLRDNFLGMAIMQDCNQGGEYWRYFMWLDNENTEVEPDRKCHIGGWIMPEPFKKLTDWTENEIITVGGKEFITNMFANGIYFWTIKPYKNENI